MGRIFRLIAGFSACARGDTTAGNPRRCGRVSES